MPKPPKKRSKDDSDDDTSDSGPDDRYSFTMEEVLDVTHCLVMLYTRVD